MEVLRHIGQLVQWADTRMLVHVYTEKEVVAEDSRVKQGLSESQVVIVTAVNDIQVGYQEDAKSYPNDTLTRYAPPISDIGLGCGSGQCR